VIVASVALIVGAAGLLVLGLWQSSVALLTASIAASLLAAVGLVVATRRGTTAWPLPARALRDLIGRAPGRGPGPAMSRTWPDHAGPAGRTARPGRSGTPEPAGPASQPARLAGQPAESTRPPAGQPAEPAGQPVGAAGPTTGRPDPPGPATQPGPATEAVTMIIPVQTATVRAGAVAAVGEPGPELADEPDPPDEPAAQQVSAADAARVGRLSTEVLVVDGRPRYHLPGCVHMLGRDSEPLPAREAVELGFTPCSLCEPDSALLADTRRM
jgi:hypothetical protein